MTGRQVGIQRRKPFMLAFVAVLAALMAGCSSSMSRVQTWEGDARDASEVAILEAPGEIEVQKVNGRSVTNFLMEDLALNYELLPGTNEVIFSYKTIWGKATRVENGEAKVVTVESAPQVVTIDARAGELYRFRFAKPATRAEAEATIADFSASIVSASGATVAESATYEPVRQQDELLSGPAVASGTSGGSGVDTLDTLKLLWQKATAEEKREFLRWAFE